MPLSELYGMTKEKLDSNHDFEPGKDLFELVREKGQVMMQAQSSRPRKGPGYNSLPSSHCLPSYNPRSRDKVVGNGSNGKMGKSGNLDSFFDEIPSSSVLSGEIGMNQDEDMMPWLSYPIDDSFQQQYCLMPELSSVTVNELSTSNNFLSMDRSRCNQLYRNSSTNTVHDVSKVNPVGHAEVTRPRNGGTHLYPLSSQQCESFFPHLRSGASDIIDGKATSSADHAVNHALAGVPSPARFPSSKMHNQDPIQPRSSSSIMNFSHFSRPVALLKANIQNVGAKLPSDLPREERIAKGGKDTCASNNPPELEATNASKGTTQQTSSQCQVVDLTPLEARYSKEPCAAKQSATVCHDNASKNEMKSNQVPCESAIRGPQDIEKTVEPVVGSSSVCSGNSVERTSDDPTHDLKRKGRDTEESECHSEDGEEESVGVKKRAPARATGSKRSRAADVHNLSERKRRDRINEKMRALQELIPNCNKVDKASMLDEAIEYLKTLQLQVQVMSMGAGLYMPPLMFQTGMQQMHLPHMAHFWPMGVGVGVGMGMGVGYGMCMPAMNNGSSYPMMQVPPMQVTPFPGPPMSGHNVVHGMTGSNVQVCGVPGVSGQGIPMQMQCAPMHPVSGGPFVNSSTGLNGCFTGVSMENVESALTPTSKDPMQNIIPPVDPTVSQREATNERFEHSKMEQNNGQVVIGNRASTSANRNDVGPSRVASE